MSGDINCPGLKIIEYSDIEIEIEGDCEIINGERCI